ncbi:HugZ family pyridoxamine 5'-phosphate oxidase [Chloroflexus sp.]|uniref:HugZ family pyridoxamine 5'-phosphate oxidase n=1 Tax=Chloroflexus sp. TaxID=1904827 RepID=UPI0026382AC8|nr:pyridoxamine 5'-phosphate oxidase family protein [uncultured Chloroflexus sp.]
MRHEDRVALRRLIEEHHTAALGTITPEGAPFVSYVLYAVERRDGYAPGLLLLLSRLAAHTGHLRADPRLSLLITASPDSVPDPQAVARVTLQGVAQPVFRDAPDYAEAQACYLARLPGQQHLFSLPDFTLFRVELREARYVGGFGRAFTLDAARLTASLSTSGVEPA